MTHHNLSSDENKAIAELKEILDKLLDKRLMIFNLYGSKAKGDYDNESDTDIAIIVKGLSRKQKKQILNIIADIEIKMILFPVQYLVSIILCFISSGHFF